jgi:hypothetical protein
MVSQIVLLLYIQKQKGVFQNMKKQKITNLLLTMALCASAVLSGCAASAANQSTTSSTPFEEAKDSGTPISSDEASSVQAYENDEVLSSEEQAKAEQERRAEIAKKYSIYEPYGMTYDTEKDRFFYNGQVVRYFKDQINSNETNSFSYDDGVIDVEPIRDEDGTLTGLKQSSDADFNARTKEQEALKAELEKAGITAGSGSFEQGDPNYRDDSLDAYTEFGVSYDKTSNHWMYDEKPIYILYDKERYTFCDKGVSDGICLNVVRDKGGNIEKLVSVDKGELEQFVK